MPELLGDGVFVRRDFLSFPVLLKMLDVVDRLATRWMPSQHLGLLGRGQTSQIRPTDIAVQSQLDQIGRAIAPATVDWARACGFHLAAAPQVQLFPVRMLGDTETPAYQEPHVDSYAAQPHPPICTSVYYVRTKDIVGGGLAVSRPGQDLSDPIVFHPTANTIVSFAGDRVHWVEPLLAGDRLSVVINLY
jgi:hypothetical protein